LETLLLKVVGKKAVLDHVSVVRFYKKPHQPFLASPNSDVYARKLDVLNRGLSGYNTDWAIPVLEQCFATQQQQQHAPKVRILTVWFGANDACLKPSPQHVPLPKFISNIKQIVNMIQSPKSPYYSPCTRIILITPPPINEQRRAADLASRSVPLPLDRHFDTTKAYAEGVKDVGAEEGVAVVDVWTELWKAAGEDQQGLNKFLSDGLHLSKDGYAVMYDTLMKTIHEKYPELHYNNLQYVFARWDEINWQDPAASLAKRDAEFK